MVGIITKLICDSLDVFNILLEESFNKTKLKHFEKKSSWIYKPGLYIPSSQCR